MKEWFLYVFTEADRDALLRAGFSLLKSDPASNIYVFINDGSLTFDHKAVRAIASSTLRF